MWRERKRWCVTTVTGFDHINGMSRTRDMAHNCFRSILHPITELKLRSIDDGGCTCWDTTGTGQLCLQAATGQGVPEAWALFGNPHAAW
jgi:hypothetical protein